MPYFIKNNLQLAANTRKGSLSEVNLFRKNDGSFSQILSCNSDITSG